MDPRVVVGISPDIKEELRVGLEAQGWNVVEGAPVRDALEKTVFITDTVPDSTEGYDVLSVGLDVSQNSSPQALIDAITQRVETSPKQPTETVIVDAQGEPNEVPKENLEIDVDAEAAQENAKQVRKRERDNGRLAFLLS